VATVFLSLGGALCYAGLLKMTQVHLVPQQTIETLREDVRAVGNALSADRSPRTLAS